METNNVVFLGAVEGSFSYNRSIDYKSAEIKKKVVLKLRSELLYAVDSDIVGMQFYLLGKHEEEQFLSYNVMLTFRVDGWRELVSGLKEEDLLQEDTVKLMLEITVGFMRGSLFIQEKNTPLEGWNLPILPIQNLLSKIHVIKASPKGDAN